jgi:Tol biopolymer transport system component
VFVSDRGGASGLWAVRVVDGKTQGEAELLKRDFRSNALIGFASDGWLLNGVQTRTTDIYVAGLDPASGALTSEPKRVNQRAVGNSWGRIAWLPDGRSLSFWSRRNERDFLVVHTLATGEERDLWDHPPGGSGQGYIGWFPDGRTLMAWEPKGQMVLFTRKDPGTGEVLGSWTAPKQPVNAQSVPFSRDLMTMFYRKKDGPYPCDGKCTFTIFGLDIESGKQREILPVRADGVGSPWMSPDGREVAYLASFDPDRVLTIAPIAGGAARELKRETFAMQGLTEPLLWSPDGNHLLVFGREYGAEALWSFPAKGGAPQKSPLHVGLTDYSSAAVSPDGTQIAFVGGKRKFEIWQLTGLFPAPKAPVAH